MTTPLGPVAGPSAAEVERRLRRPLTDEEGEWLQDVVADAGDLIEAHLGRDLAEYGALAYGDPLVAAGLLLARWAALRGREVEGETIPAETEGAQNAGADTGSDASEAANASDSAV